MPRTCPTRLRPTESCRPREVVRGRRRTRTLYRTPSALSRAVPGTCRGSGRASRWGSPRTVPWRSLPRRPRGHRVLVGGRGVGRHVKGDRGTVAAGGGGLQLFVVPLPRDRLRDTRFTAEARVETLRCGRDSRTPGVPCSGESVRLGFSVTVNVAACILPPRPGHDATTWYGTGLRIVRHGERHRGAVILICGLGLLAERPLERNVNRCATPLSNGSAELVTHLCLRHRGRESHSGSAPRG